ncbi:TPA: hypothetical protein JH885_001074 [Acinetobacter baumannii]|nr:hypothetical protein [Acinetobacter baumannii]
MEDLLMAFWKEVHGGIRHLENCLVMRKNGHPVHGGIRHLEKQKNAEKREA